jgi:hypothetical protein
VRNSFGVLGNSLDTNVSAACPDLRDLSLELPLRGLRGARAKPVAQPFPEVLKPVLILRPALIPSPTQPGVELILDRSLDDQPGAQLGQLGK